MDFVAEPVEHLEPEDRLDDVPNINFIECFDEGKTPREGQIDIASWLDTNKDSEVKVITAPTAFGKSRVATMIARYHEMTMTGRTALIVPNKMLQDQYEGDFPLIPLLKGNQSFECLGNPGKTCGDFKRSVKNYCKPVEFKASAPEVCCYVSKYAEVKAAPTAIYNYHSFLHYKKRNSDKTILIADEAHNLVKFISSLYEYKMWKIESEYPDFTDKGEFNKSRMIEKEEVVEWFRARSATLLAMISELELRIDDPSALRNIKEMEEEINKLEFLSAGLTNFPNDFLVLRKKEIYRNASPEFRSFKDTEQEYLYIKPLNVSRLSSSFFRGIDKIYLLSATISKETVKRLGLDDRDVAYYDGKSPIDKGNRPFVYWPIASMSYKDRQKSIPKIVEAIHKIVDSEKNKGKKGVIHATYEIALALKNRGLGYDRMMFHTNRDKAEVYERFLSDKTNKILVASGMSEGIDLYGEEFGFQIICMLQRPSLADDANFHMLKNDSAYYSYETVLTVVQQTGRICRGPDDKGTTWMIDSQFGYFFESNISKFPEYFIESVVDTRGK